MYITKYMLKINEKRPEFKGKVLSSAGIGKGYLNRNDAKRNAFKEEETDETYKLRNGIKINLPNYYKNHIYTEEEKEKLWIIKQEKGYRYIQGEKVDMNSEEEIRNITEFYRARGVTLYKDNPEAWDKEKNYARYKRNRRKRHSNKGNETFPRKVQKINKKITKTLVLHRTRRRKWKNTPSRHILVRKRINTKMLAIRVCIYRGIRQRKNNHVYNKIYAKDKRKKT